MLIEVLYIVVRWQDINTAFILRDKEEMRGN